MVAPGLRQEDPLLPLLIKVVADGCVKVMIKAVVYRGSPRVYVHLGRFVYLTCIMQMTHYYLVKSMCSTQILSNGFYTCLNYGLQSHA